MMGRIVYIQGAICFNDLVKLLLCSEKLVLGLSFPDTFQCLLTLSFCIPKDAVCSREDL